MSPRRRSLCFCLSLIALSIPIEAQDVTYPESFDEEQPLFGEALGNHTWDITTDSEEAQAYFTQGLNFMYAFTPEDAAHAFREAQERDPDCAMCYWGEAWAWGPYLNSRMRESNNPRAWAAISTAREKARNATRMEQDLINAMSQRYTEEWPEDGRAHLDSAYARAMEAVYQRYPNHNDVGTLTGEALMLLNPWGGVDVNDPYVANVHGLLQGILARDIRHPGACHLFIHATEITVVPHLAEPCAAYLGNEIPGASHINHMPSHTFNRVGRWGESVRANIQAWHSDLKSEIGEGFAIYPTHNLHMLLFAASYDGQSGIANQAARDYTKIYPDGSFYEVLTLLRFGRFGEILDHDDAPSAPLQNALWEFARGYAHLREGNMNRARAYLASVRDAEATLGDSTRFRGHTATQLLGITAAILEAEILREDGMLDEAIAVLEPAVELEEQLRYDEPEPLNFSVKHWMGALLLEADRPAEAEAVYRAELEKHPHNGWSLYGLVEALEAQGKDASEAKADLEASWARSDTWLRGSRF